MVYVGAGWGGTGRDRAGQDGGRVEWDEVIMYGRRGGTVGGVVREEG